MNMGAEGFVVASHVAVIVALAGLFHVSSAVRLRPEALAQVLRSRAVGFAAMIAVAVLIVERVYYVAAVALRPQGIDLWQTHPVPEVLSLAVAASTYAVAITAAIITGAAAPRTRASGVLHVICSIAAWVALAVVLA